MSNQNTTTSSFQQLNIIYLALVAGQVAFASVAYFFLVDEAASSSELGILAYIVPALSLITIGASYFIYNMLIQNGQELGGFEAKIGHYRTSNIVRWALVEGGNLFAVVIFLLSGVTYILAFFVLGMGVFFLYRPSKDRFVGDYNLNGEERMMVERS